MHSSQTPGYERVTRQSFWPCQAAVAGSNVVAGPRRHHEVMTHTHDPCGARCDRQVEEHVAVLVEELNDCMPVTPDEMRGYVAACRHWLRGCLREPGQPADVRSELDFSAGVRMGLVATRNYALGLLRRKMRQLAHNAVAI